MSMVHLNLGGLNYSFALRYLFWFIYALLEQLPKVPPGPGLTAYIPVSKDTSYLSSSKHFSMWQTWGEAH